MASIPRGQFVWYDLLTNAPDAAIAFYRQIIGWETQVWEGPQPYTMWARADGGTIGGVMDLPPEAAEAGAPPHWMSYLSTPDVEQTIADAKRLGATVHLPATDIPQVGRFAIIADPQGATIALFEPSEERARGEPQLGDVAWNELATSDSQAAFAFYQKAFSWDKISEMDMGGGMTYLIFGQNGKQYGGMYNFMPDQPPFPYWTPYVNITGLDARVEKVSALGGKVLNGPMDVPGGGRIAQCMDPQGAVFALFELPKS